MSPESGVSIVIPTFNRREGLRRLLNSLQRQTWCGPLEIVVTDNASTDGTLDASTDLLQQFDGQVHVLRHETPIDVVDNWTAGLRRATHPWVKIVWSDDWLESSALDTLVKAQIDSGVSVVTCGAKVWINSKQDKLMYQSFRGTYALTDVVHNWLSNTRTFPLSATAALLTRDNALAGLGAFKEVCGCRGSAIGPDLSMLYWGLFANGLGFHVPLPLVNFGGRNSTADEPSITHSTSRWRRRLCYDQAILQLLELHNSPLFEQVENQLAHRRLEAMLAGYFPAKRYGRIGISLAQARLEARSVAVSAWTSLRP